VQIPVNDIRNLFELLFEKLRVSPGKQGFHTIADQIQEVDYRYVREKLYAQMLKAEKEGESTVGLRLEKIDVVAKYLGFKGFIDFQTTLKVHPQLLAHTGVCYSYLRKNVSEGCVLQSPVKIEREGNKVMLTLRGPDRTFYGNLELERDCLFCLLSAEGKSFYHIYKVGVIKTPEVIQGVFSGVTSGGIPIAGRCVLVKQNQKFESLTNKALLVSELKESDDLLHQKLASYFEHQHVNNLMAGKAVGFDIHDLDNWS